MSSSVVKRGYAQVKNEGIQSFLWSKKWLLLREQTLTFHRNENTYEALTLIFLKDVQSVQRVEQKPYCFEVVTKEKPYFISVRSDEELYSWIDDIYQRLPSTGIGNPTGFVHQFHGGFDLSTGVFTGLPDDMKKLLETSNISMEDMSKDPQTVLDVLEFYTAHASGRDVPGASQPSYDLASSRADREDEWEQIEREGERERAREQKERERRDYDERGARPRKSSLSGSVALSRQVRFSLMVV
ncbi:Protein kinase [Irineochytrium annulatum]|nr:Protein kinase [Irineochytrium annulatum]